MTCPRPHPVDFGSRFWAQFGLLCLKGNVFKGVSWSLGWRVRQSELLLRAHTSVASFLIPVSSLFLARVQIMQRCRITHRQVMEVSLPRSAGVPGAGERHSTRDKGHEEGGSAYAKAGSSLGRAPGYSRASTPQKPESAYFIALCSRLWLYWGLSPTTISLSLSKS